MNEFEKETYTLMHELRTDIKPETLQARLQYYIKKNKDVEELSAFCRDLEVAQKAKQAKKAADDLLKSRLSKQRTLRGGPGKGASLSPKSDETLDPEKRRKLTRNKTRELIQRKGTSTRQLVTMFLIEKEEERAIQEEEEKQNNMLEKSVSTHQQPGTTFAITASQRNSILRKLEQIPLMEQQHEEYIAERRAEHENLKSKKTLENDTKAQQRAKYLAVVDKVKEQLAKRGKSQFQLNMNDYKAFDHAPFTPKAESESSNSMVSIKEEEEILQHQSSSESTASEATKQRFKDEELEIHKQELENRKLRKLQLKEEQNKETLARRKL